MIVRWRNAVIVITAALTALGFVSCVQSDIEHALTLVVISDTHARVPGFPDDAVYDNEGNLGNLQSLVNTVNWRVPDADAVVVSGDMVGCLFSDDPADYMCGKTNPAESFKTIMDGLSMPWYAVLGNHDYETNFNTTSYTGISATNVHNVENVWRRVLGIEPYYSTVRNGIKLIMLNSCRGGAVAGQCITGGTESMCAGVFQEDQLAWLEAELAGPEPCILFLHHPLVTDNTNTVWSAMGRAFQVAESDRFYDIVQAWKSKIGGIFVGHGHIRTHDKLFGTIPVYETGATGDYFGLTNQFYTVRLDNEGYIYDIRYGACNAPAVPAVPEDSATVEKSIKE